MIFCANLKQVMAMKQAFIAKWGINKLREDYERATKNQSSYR